MKSLGLLITISHDRMVHLQFVLDRIRARLSGWKGKLINVAGRKDLVKCVLSTMPTFTLTVLCAPKKFYKEVNKTRCRFLWAQEEELSEEKLKICWKNVCFQVKHGGLGISDLGKFSRALRLRWLWLA